MRSLETPARLSTGSTCLARRAWKAPEWSACFLELTDPSSVKPVFLDELVSAYHLTEILRAQASRSKPRVQGKSEL